MSLHADITDALARAGLTVDQTAIAVEVHASTDPSRRVAITAMRTGIVVEWQDADGVHSCQIVDGEVGPVERNDTFVLDTIGGAP